MNKKILTVGFALAIAAFANCAFGVSTFSQVRGYVSAYDDHTDSAGYSAYVLDVAEMSLTEAASVSAVLSWLENNWEGLGENACATALSYIDYDGEQGTHGFAADGLSLDGAGGQYYFAALFADGDVYGNVLSYSSATSGGGRLDFDVGGGAFAGNSAETGWGSLYTEAIPEPTSGLMLLLGLGLIALRRRRVG